MGVKGVEGREEIVQTVCIVRPNHKNVVNVADYLKGLEVLTAKEVV